MYVLLASLICRENSEKFFTFKKFSKGVLLNFLPKMLPGETLCKFFQIFPPKDLVYIYEEKLSYLFIK